MKQIIIYLFVFCFSVTGFSQDSWELKKDRNGVNIYTRDYPNSKFKEYKAQMTVKTTLDVVKNIILDAEHLKDWNYKTSRSSVLRTINENRYIFYLFNDMPWPVMNRDHVSDVVVTYPTEKSVLITITPNNNVLPETNGVVRITNFKGFWLIKETDKGVSITNQLFGEWNACKWQLKPKIYK